MNNLEKYYFIDVRNVSSARLARENPALHYVVLDSSIQHHEAHKDHDELPNLHFIEHKMGHPAMFPFDDGSVERVEINHVWTPLTPRPMDYVHILRESGRILKRHGVLAITEKEDNLKNIRAILSNNSYLDLDPTIQVLTKMPEPHRSYYSQLAFANEDQVNCLELRKK